MKNWIWEGWRAILRERLPEFAGPLIVEQFPHGHSNLTYLLKCGTKEAVLRRPPFGNQVQTAHDMGCEYRVLSKLSAVFPLARPYLFCDDVDVLGTPFYVMERRRGLILRKAVPPGASLPPEKMRELSCALIETLARLHAVDYQAAGLAELGKPAGYVERQVSGWTKRYENVRTDEVAAMENVARWLAANLPGAESGVAVIHNDYKFDNLLLNPEEPREIVGGVGLGDGDAGRSADGFGNDAGVLGRGRRSGAVATGADGADGAAGQHDAAEAGPAVCSRERTASRHPLSPTMYMAYSRSR